MRELRYTVPAEDDGRQIKRVVRGRMGVSHRVFSALKARGLLLLDGESVHADRIVRAGQTIRLPLQEEEGPGAALGEDAPVGIVYEDEDLLIVDKDAPLPCQCSPKQRGGALENRLAYYFRQVPGYTFRPVNRLDKGTSGLMAVALHAHAQRLLGAQLHTGAFVREYLAVVEGGPPRAEGVVDAPIGKADGATVRREVRPDGRPALTRYRVERVAGALTLLRLRLETGRTHQIRVHMAHMGCPVLGDFLYGREDDRLPGRFALHSTHLAVDHPLDGRRLCFDSPLPAVLQRLLDP